MSDATAEQAVETSDSMVDETDNPSEDDAAGSTTPLDPGDPAPSISPLLPPPSAGLAAANITRITFKSRCKSDQPVRYTGAIRSPAGRLLATTDGIPSAASVRRLAMPHAFLHTESTICGLLGPGLSYYSWAFLGHRSPRAEP